MTMPRNEEFLWDTDKNSKEFSDKKPSIEEIVTILRQLSKILEIANSQNPELASSIGKLANILSRYRDKCTDDVLNSLTINTRIKSSKPIMKRRIPDLEINALTLEQIERLLESKEIGRVDLINIAATRFGMSKSELMKTKRTFIMERIKIAISNLRTIDIIGKQASGNK